MNIVIFLNKLGKVVSFETNVTRYKVVKGLRLLKKNHTVLISSERFKSESSSLRHKSNNDEVKQHLTLAMGPAPYGGSRVVLPYGL